MWEKCLVTQMVIRFNSQPESDVRKSIEGKDIFRTSFILWGSGMLVIEGRQLKSSSWILCQSAPWSMLRKFGREFRSTTPGTFIAVYMVRKRKRRNPTKCLEQKWIFWVVNMTSSSTLIVLFLKTACIKDNATSCLTECRQNKLILHIEARQCNIT